MDSPSGVDFRGPSSWVLPGPLFHLCNPPAKWEFSLSTSPVSRQISENSKARYFILCFGKRKHMTRRMREYKNHAWLRSPGRPASSPLEEWDCERGILLLSLLHVNCTKALGSECLWEEGVLIPELGSLNGFFLGGGVDFKGTSTRLCAFFPSGRRFKAFICFKRCPQPCSWEPLLWVPLKLILLACSLSICQSVFLMMCTELKSCFSFFCTYRQ